MSDDYIQLGSQLQDAAADPNATPVEVQLGTKLRDAAIDPQPGDYQAPVRGTDGHPVSVQAVSPRSGNPPFVNGARWSPPEAP
ncbi:hypothetical protein [Arthrobacter sp. NPDC056493]|uniref:hypothetical protein n=1 Tax=Arthrobacter sp. NPDC056493 TaxID=3345839 RepID=UPI00366EF1E4